MPKPYQTLDVNLREKEDSFLLRYAKDISINTNHSPKHSIVQATSPRQLFAKASFERYIGDIRDEDFSVPLDKNCNHRCAKANHLHVSKIDIEEPSDYNSEYMKDSELETASV
jgi:hypothetical protein